MDRYPSTVVSTTRPSALTTNKVLRNTYLLLSATLAFSAVMAGVSMALNFPNLGLFTLLIYFGLLFATHKTQNSAWGLVCVFALTGFLGLTLGPLLNAYLSAYANGGELVMIALGTTALTFLGLSAYAIRSERDFSFLGGFLMIGIIGAFVLGLVAYFFNMPTLALVVSGMFVVAMAGLILFQTSAIIRGEETNYIMATVTFYVSLYNLFTSLLHLLGFASGED
jgi:modulator of FtsH protease